MRRGLQQQNNKKLRNSATRFDDGYLAEVRCLPPRKWAGAMQHDFAAAAAAPAGAAQRQRVARAARATAPVAGTTAL